MREILFRAKRKDDGEWVTGFYTHFADDKGNETHRIYSGYAETDCGDYYPDFDSVLPKTVGEFTGLTDKNGVKIFEGDIIKYENPGWVIKYAVIKFGEYGNTPDNPKYNIGFYLHWLNGPFVRQDLGFWLEQRDITVIGNIYDNAELLGGDDNA